MSTPRSSALRKIDVVGIPGGPSIQNKKTILRELDKFLGYNKSPIFELLLVDSSCRNWKGQFGRFGHSAVRYRLKEKEGVDIDMVMNIVGLKNHRMVNFLSTEEYLFGTSFGGASHEGTQETKAGSSSKKEGGKGSAEQPPPFFAVNGEGNEQAGVYNRQFYGLRLGEDLVSEKQIIALHAAYVALQKSHEANARSFVLTGCTLANLRQSIPLFEDLLCDPTSHFAITGNCALWTSEGMVSAGIISTKRQFPKALWVDLYERYMRVDPQQVHIIEYREADGRDPKITPYVHRHYQGWWSIRSFVSPMLPIKSWRYWRVDSMADAVVRLALRNVDEEMMTVQKKSTTPSAAVVAIVEKGPKNRPSIHFLARHLSLFVPLCCALAYYHLRYTKSHPDVTVSKKMLFFGGFFVFWFFRMVVA